MANLFARRLGTALLVALAGAAPSRATGADTCAAATAEQGSFPLQLSGTTTGRELDYDLAGFAADTDSSTCTASTPCAGGAAEGSSARGAIFLGTGNAPDFAFEILTDAACTLEITLEPTDLGEGEADDLALVVYQATCSNNKSDCACVDDTGGFGDLESVTLQAQGGVRYYVVVDGYDEQSPVEPPYEEGPFDLTIARTSGSCNLCPESGCAVSPPAPPTGLAASDGTHEDRIAVSWNAAAGATRYEIHRHTADDSSGASALATDLVSTAYDDFSAVPGQAYFFWAKACNAGGCSDFSAGDAGSRAEAAGDDLFADDFETGGCAWSSRSPDYCS
jgi:hypothetical protein